MNWKEYLPLAEKTLSRNFYCTEEFDQKILHAIIGSLTEIEEILENYDEDGNLMIAVDKQGSVGEESADIFWYLSILYRELEIEDYNLNENLNFKNSFSSILSFTKVCLKFLDLLKKKIYYGKDVNDDEMIMLTIKLRSILEYYCKSHNIDVGLMLDKNIDKLKARYGEKFSSEKAINRDLEKEKSILENTKTNE